MNMNMQKHILLASVAVSLIFIFSACGNAASSASTSVEASAESTIENSAESTAESTPTSSSVSNSVAEPKETVPPAVLETLTEAEFQELLLKQALTVVSTKYVVQDTKYKSLYPDMLQAVIENHTEADIKDAVVAFVAWDKNNLPVKIKGSMDFSDGSYIREVNYEDINLIPGATYGSKSGFSIDEDCGISAFQAIVVSFETFDGETWENPYYDAWSNLYAGKKYSDDMSVEVEIVDDTFSTSANSTDNSGSNALPTEDLEAQIATQEVRVVSTKYVVQDAKYKSLYPDMLQAVVQNDSSVDIRDAVVAFVAWDANGLPVKIKGDVDFSDGAYIREVNYNDINLIPNATYGNDSGFAIDENCEISAFKAIVVSYTDFDDKTWENPLYEAWRQAYEGKKTS
jgi:hypothetical protein